MKIKDVKVWVKGKLLKPNIDYSFNIETGKLILKEPAYKRDVKHEYIYYKSDEKLPDGWVKHFNESKTKEMCCEKCNNKTFKIILKDLFDINDVYGVSGIWYVLTCSKCNFKKEIFVRFDKYEQCLG